MNDVDWGKVYTNLRDADKFPEYCADHLKIQTKERTLSPFVFNASQMEAWLIIKQWISVGAWFIILKARQVGISTLIEAIIDWITTLNSDTRSLIMAHDAETSSRLYQMFKTYHENKPAWLKPDTASSGNAKGINFKTIRSSVRVITAGSDNASSGDTFHLAHLSEYAKWEHPKEVMASLVPAIPKDALVFLESTPLGMNHFYREWVAATNGNSKLIPIFLPWFNDKGYSLPDYKGSQIEPRGDERYYVEKHGLNQGQVNWMRSMIESPLCSGDFNVFLQEFPFDDKSCFLSSGSPYFDMGALRDLDLELRREKPDSVRGAIDNDGKFVLDVNGDIELWDVPDAEEKIAYRYVIGADCCEGGNAVTPIDDGQKREGDSDWNFGYIWDRVLRKQVGQIRNKFDPDKFAFQLYHLVVFFGNGLAKAYWPLLIVERNNPGQAVLMELKRLYTRGKVPFSRLYHQGDMSKDAEPTNKELGFRTQADGEAPRLVILSEVQRRIRERRSGIQSLVLVDQCLTFAKNKRMRPEAQEGRYDDGVIAKAITLEGERRDHQWYEIKAPVRRTALVERMIKQNRKKHKGNPYA